MKTNPYALEDHPLATLFPMMKKDDEGELEKAIVANGQREPIVLFEGRVLDGRNRLRILEKNKIEPVFREFDYKLEGDPLQFVMDANFYRRHLTTSQRAAIAAESLETAWLGPKSNGKDAPKETLALSAEKPRKPRRREAAATAMKVSPRSVQAAITLKKTDPAKFADVKAGKASLNKSVTTSKRQSLDDKYFAAVGRIKAVAGKASADAIFDRDAVLKSGKKLAAMKETIALAALGDADLKRIALFVEEGWNVKEALKYKPGTLDRKSRIDDLITRAAAEGIGGKLQTEVDGWVIVVKRA